VKKIIHRNLTKGNVVFIGKIWPAQAKIECLAQFFSMRSQCFSVFLPCLPPLKGLGSASRRFRKVLSMSIRVLMAAILFTLSSSLRGSGERLEEGTDVAECFTSCYHGGHFVYFVFYLFPGKRQQKV
jgi:hypothetical protein